MSHSAHYCATHVFSVKAVAARLTHEHWYMLALHELLFTHLAAAAAATAQQQQNSAMPLRYETASPGFTLPVRLISAMPVQRGTSSVPHTRRSPQNYSSQESVSSAEAGQVQTAAQRRRVTTHGSSIRRTTATAAATRGSRRAHDYTLGLSSRSTSSGGSVCSSVASSSSSSSITSVRRAGAAASVSSLEAGEQRVLRSQELEPGEIRR
jgi:hypothetical protein